ncbi:PREDICTED: nucleolar protein 9 [Vollenhovia emeryi]|uniref:nucleolar protein 9 n=1 Tax=Vollenhovia emeryi TaxID=411798 RepID=UPI0005F4F023|nr:PREDICTED: nucleolar protein 9 [Vollenhovia emeryi]XP_011878927.1 PREDICTED: nucleolar protein 9 [Vollenhovia emeryi]
MNSTTEARETNQKKRKNKRSNAQMAKKFARQRNGPMQDTQQYMMSIMDVIRNDSTSPEEKTILVRNVYQEIAGCEVKWACNQLGSLAMDSLLKYANLEDIRQLVRAFESSLRRLSNDRFASYILQKIIIVCADRGNRVAASSAGNVAGDKTSTESENAVDAATEIKPSEAQSYNDIVLKLSRYVLNNSEEFVFDAYANYVLRTVVECLSGLIEYPKSIPESSRKNKKHTMPDLAKRRPVIQDYKALLTQSCDRLQKWPQFRQFGREQMTSGLVQSILYSLKDVDSDLVNTIIQKITTECFQTGEGEKLSDIFNSEYSVRILEACLVVAEPKTFEELYRTLFAENLEYLCSTQSTNFSVQKLLDYCVNKEIFEEIFDKVVEHFPKILKQGFTGILLSTGNACLRLQAKQGPFVNAMVELLKCDASGENQTQLVRCITTLKKPSQLTASDSLVLHLHGSLIMQAILKFNKPIKAVNALLGMNNEELVRLFGEPKGSRILDAFMDSKYIGEKSREKLCKTLHGAWAELARSKHGSRCVDKIWAWARMNQKVIIMEELAAEGQSLGSTQPGRIISTKLNVPSFAKDKKAWLQLQGKEEKTKAMFADVIGKTEKLNSVR